jgi:hypothetical protein
MHMPYLNCSRMDHRMAAAGFKYAKGLAAKAELPYGRVRNAVGGHDPLHLADIYTLAELLAQDGEDVKDVVADIIANNEGVPDEPPKTPRPPAKPPTRGTTEKTKGPRRNAEAVA